MTTKTSAVRFTPVHPISLKAHPEITEAWVQQVIFDDPTLLGLGSSITARDRERYQSSGGRLDLLLEDEESPWKLSNFYKK